MSAPADYVRAAFALGYASAGPWAWPADTLHASFTAVAAEVARLHDDTTLIEATIHLGRLEGVHKAVFNRRLHLIGTAVDQIVTAWAKAAAAVDVGGMVRRVRQQAGLVEAAEPVPPDVSASDVATIAASFLASMPDSEDWSDLGDDLGDVLRQSYAEGQAGAVALSGGVSIDFDLMVSHVLDALPDHPDWAEPDEWLSQALDGTASDLGRLLSKLIGDGASYEDMVGQASELVGLGNRAVRYSVDYALGQAMSLGARDLYAAEGVAQVAFVTAGDSRVDEMCEEAEARGPYALNDAPIPPLHGFCRCALIAQDWASTGLQNLLDTYSEG